MELVEIDGPTVYLRLQGACGSCPSSTSTMTMGIRRKLQESIPVSHSQLPNSFYISCQSCQALLSDMKGSRQCWAFWRRTWDLTCGVVAGDYGSRADNGRGSESATDR